MELIVLRGFVCSFLVPKAKKLGKTFLQLSEPFTFYFLLALQDQAEFVCMIGTFSHQVMRSLTCIFAALSRPSLAWEFFSLIRFLPSNIFIPLLPVSSRPLCCLLKWQASFFRIDFLNKYEAWFSLLSFWNFLCHLSLLLFKSKNAFQPLIFFIVLLCPHRFAEMWCTLRWSSCMSLSLLDYWGSKSWLRTERSI